MDEYAKRVRKVSFDKVDRSQTSWRLRARSREVYYSGKGFKLRLKQCVAWFLNTVPFVASLAAL